MAEMQWYIIHTYSGFENRVKESLANRIEAFGLKDSFGEIMIPTENVVEVRDGKKRVSSRKFFPGYVLVQMLMSDEASQLVRNTPKVTGFVGAEALQPEEMDRIFGHMTRTTEAPKPKYTFEPGEKVKIIEGPFASFQGVVESVNAERGTLTVMVTIFGRSTPVELNFLQVEKL
ncbi:MAG: transcription termination/antitermination protein NusG [Acidobacteria bacterium]|jgi:transcriptional antiterminator NusG|nr:transcription termination/antitermination protein NusG [Acidobacteriota bacterium]